MLTTCLECDGRVSSLGAKGPHCGAPVDSVPPLECPDCSTRVTPRDEKCPGCGYPTSKMEMGSRSALSKTAAVLVVSLALLVAAGGVVGYLLVDHGEERPEQPEETTDASEEDTPERAHQRWTRAMKAEDWEAAFECVAPSARRQGEAVMERRKAELRERPTELAAVAKELGTTPDAFLGMSYRELVLHRLRRHPGAVIPKSFLEQAKIIDKQVESNRCTLTLFRSQGEGTADLVFVKEGDRWYWSGMGQESSSIARPRPPPRESR